jgi:geranylgeranyl pyrophosphate synthase
VAAELQGLRGQVAAWIEAASAEVRAPLTWQLRASSKFFRPLTVFACHRAVSDGPVPPRVMRSAVAVELFHNVSLIVDDILDRSRYRRGKLTLHCRYGELTALMTAGYITAGGFKLVATDAYVTGLLAELMQRLGIAECVQWRLRRQPLGVAGWQAIAAEDTGAMFEICARLATRDGRLQRFGLLLGILYHGCDDVADVRGGAALGGGGHEDLRDGILTLPAALATRGPRGAALFRDGANGHGRLRRRFAAALPEAERYLDDIAAQAAAEARRNARHPAILLKLIEHTRALSRA